MPTFSHQQIQKLAREFIDFCRHNPDEEIRQAVECTAINVMGVEYHGNMTDDDTALMAELIFEFVRGRI
ncbi:MAG: hypothetical protein GY950_00680 [bacterium]|nr:hypothetical protein [bacterium]